MKFLLDQNQSHRIKEFLLAAGHDVVHVRDVGLSGAPDPELMAFAVREDLVVVSGDTDFGDLLAASNAVKPSVVLFRRQEVAALTRLLRFSWPILSQWKRTWPRVLLLSSTRTGFGFEYVNASLPK